MTKINIVIPMAGKGTRFSQAGYKLPKPFIDVDGTMMVERVLDNLAYEGANYTLIAWKEHLERDPESLSHLLKRPNVSLLAIDRFTHGTACTMLSAHRLINNDTPLLIANSDQIVDLNMTDFIDDCFNRDMDGSILTFHDTHPKWSFARTDEHGTVVEVREKQPISTHATVGLYLFKRGSDFVNGTMDMIAKADTVNDEFYVCPVYNYVIADGRKIGIYEIEKTQMHGMGTPEDLEQYLEFLKVEEEA